jgi:hypothetical protein
MAGKGRKGVPPSEVYSRLQESIRGLMEPYMGTDAYEEIVGNQASGTHPISRLLAWYSDLSPIAKFCLGALIIFAPLLLALGIAVFPATGVRILFAVVYVIVAILICLFLWEVAWARLVTVPLAIVALLAVFIGSLSYFILNPVQ